MSDTQTYRGGCHCGKVRFEVTTALEKLMACNCSICSKRGYLLTFVVADQFKQTAGSNELSDYQFGKHRLHHLFCRHCGVAAFAKGEGKNGAINFAINARCLDDIALDTIPVVHFDGKSL